MNSERENKTIFWGCFIALITTAFAFVTRTFLVNDPSLWPAEFGFDKVQGGELFGAGIWPFAISIILFSLVIDKIGYRIAMLFSFVCYGVYAAMALKAYGMIHPAGGALAGADLAAAQKAAFKLLYNGSIILGLGNGTVEAFANPLVATIFSKEKTKWLNMLHAGWPGGLVLGGVISLLLGDKVQHDWRVLVYLIALPAVIYLLILARAKFPVNERVASGTSYREMLAELGVLGAALASYFVIAQLGEVFHWTPGIIYGTLAVIVVAYGAYCRSLGRPLLFLLCLVMIPLATTELGTDGAITGIMEEPLRAANHNPLWVLIYTSAIMCFLRFRAGAIAHRISPLGLLCGCSFLAILGLLALSHASGLVMIFAAATLYACGKTFFWPTTLAVVAEQYPKGGALTLNAIAGIGMLTVGIIGLPLIGGLQEKSAHAAIAEKKPELVQQISTPGHYILGNYTAADEAKIQALPEADKTAVEDIAKHAKQGALATVAIFPCIMLVSFLAMILYFKSRGGYKPVTIETSNHPVTEA
jgi:MFS family permease